MRGLETRIGARALSLLGTPPNAAVLGALSEQAMSLADLQVTAGSPGSTLRLRLRQLRGAGAIAPRGEAKPGGSCEYELTPAGRDLVLVTEALERWLLDAPGGATSVGADRGKAAIGALAEAWSATLLRALAAKPLSITELDSLIGSLNYPMLERRIAAMRRSGQVEARSSGRRETPYAVTDWLRRGVGPLLTAIRWEHRHMSGKTPATGIDIEAILLLTMPLVDLDEDRSGTARLAVDLPTSSNGGGRFAGGLVEFQEGRLTACRSRLDGDADAWASGSLAAWLAALVDDDPASLELGGDGQLARGVISGIHGTLYASAVRPRGPVLA